MRLTWLFFFLPSFFTKLIIYSSERTLTGKQRAHTTFVQEFLREQVNQCRVKRRKGSYKGVKRMFPDDDDDDVYRWIGGL